MWYEYDRGIRRDEQKKVEKEKRRLEKEVRMRRRFEHQMEMIGDLELRHREVLGRLEELESRVGVSSNPGGGKFNGAAEVLRAVLANSGKAGYLCIFV